MRSAAAVIALAGQPNCGKSTVFNALTGARQHVANWPGVTVESKRGWYRIDGRRIEVVDLPGAYSLTAQSPEERVARDFLLRGNIALAVNVIDASSLKQSLNLTLQLREMGTPLLINLNMMDAAARRGLSINTAVLERLIGAPVVPTSMKKGRGVKELARALAERLDKPWPSATPSIDYGPMEPFLRAIEERLAVEDSTPWTLPRRWAAVRLMEGDAEVQNLIQQDTKAAGGPIALAAESRIAFARQTGEAPEVHIVRSRRCLAETIAAACTDACIEQQKRGARPLSERIDRIVCHPIVGPLILLAVIYLLYYLSIVWGYKLTEYTWPVLAGLRRGVASIMPTAGFIDIPLIRSFSLWLVDSIAALLNYVPIFFILFSLIAVLEDSGYMPRMAFIMDRVLRRFGLHGQSVLPMVLGGVYVGGCAVPAVMSCKGIPDERSRLATILTIPLLNCTAKLPLHFLLINAYFAAHKGFAMFFISSVSLLLVLPIAKLLSLTALREKETALFVMEMPDYHLPTIRGVLVKALERVWLYLKKITTIVAAVAIVLFVLLQFPGLNAERMGVYENRKRQLIDDFRRAVAGTAWGRIAGEEEIMQLIRQWDARKRAGAAAGTEQATASAGGRLKGQKPEVPDMVQGIVRPGGDPEAIKANRALRSLARGREALLLDMRRERLENSLLGHLGKSLEPVTARAGFDWRINVALLSALAAKESAVATLGAIYEPADPRGSLEERLASEGAGLTPLHALALMLFMVFYPPCIAAAIAVKVQTGSIKWMLFSVGYPVLLGAGSAMLVFSVGGMLGISGIQAMGAFYGLALCFVLVAGLLKQKTGGGELFPGREIRTRDNHSTGRMTGSRVKLKLK